MQHTIQTLAAEVADHLTTDTRDDGKIFVRSVDDTPEWIHDLIFEAHEGGEMLPDDYRYSFIYSVCLDLADVDEDLDREGIEDLRHELCEPDTYTDDLLAWLSSRLSRKNYVSEVIEEYGAHCAGHWLESAQAREREEVFMSVLDSLEGRLDELEDELTEEG